MATALKNIEPGEGPPRNDLAPVRTQALDATPERYVVRELTMALDGGFQFLYRDPGLAQPLPAGGIAAVVAGFAAPAAAVAFVAAVRGMDGETPLDLQIYGPPIFVVLRLDPALNWRFSTDHPAISLKDNDVADHYGGLRHVMPDGTVQTDPGDGCRIAYFAANPPAVGEAGQYSHGFNFHVELTRTGANGKSEALPIIIDPDVGYPGGSNT